MDKEEEEEAASFTSIDSTYMATSTVIKSSVLGKEIGGAVLLLVHTSVISLWSPTLKSYSFMEFAAQNI